MQVRLAVLADWAATTEHGKLVIAGIFENINVPTLPATHPTMALVLRLVAEPGEAREHLLTLRLVDPDGTEVLPPFVTQIRFSEPHPIEGARAQVVLNMPGVTFKLAGAHRMDVLIDGRLESSIDLFVRHVPPVVTEAAESE